MNIPKITHGRPAVALSATAALAIAGGAYNYLPAWDASEQVTKYLSAGIASFVAYAVLLTLSILTAPKRRADGGPGGDLGRALVLAQQTGERIARKIRGTSPPMAIGHYLEKAGDPSPLSTAYAARAVLACPAVIQSAPLLELLRYIDSCRQGDGWRATSQAMSRPEVTADIARVIRAIDGDSAAYLAAIEGLLNQVANDHASTDSTYVATSVLSALPDLPQVESTTAKIRDAITNGFIKQDGTNGYWTATLGAARSTASPSVAATARCLISLHAHTASAGKDSIKAQCQAAMNWLASRSSYGNETEQIVRPLSAGSSEVLVPRHFSAALVVLAACAWRDLTGAKEISFKAIREVLALHRDGYWRWDDGQAPVWMNSQGIEAANAHAIAFGESGVS